MNKRTLDAMLASAKADSCAVDYWVWQKAEFDDAIEQGIGTRGEWTSFRNHAVRMDAHFGEAQTQNFDPAHPSYYA